jgi:hypothetical protein
MRNESDRVLPKPSEEIEKLKPAQMLQKYTAGNNSLTFFNQLGQVADIDEP